MNFKSSSTIRLDQFLKFILLSFLGITAFFSFLPNHTFAQINSDPRTEIIKIGEATKLPGFDAGHSNQAYQAGASNITSAIYFTIDFFKYLIGGISVLMLIISGIKLIVAGRKIDEIYPKQKEQLKFSAMALIIIIVAESLIKQVIFGEAGEIFRSSSEFMSAAERGRLQLIGFYNFLQFLVGSLGVLFLVISGVRLLLAGGDSEKIGKVKTHIFWSIMGILLAGVSEFVIKGIVFPNQGTRLTDLNMARAFIVQITNFISGFIATLSVIAIIYAGYLYVISPAVDQVAKAKKVLFGAIIGILIAMAAFGLVNTFIKVEPLNEFTHIFSNFKV